MDADELDLLRSTLDRALGAVRVGGPDADRVLADFGVADLLDDGGPAIAVVFEELGRKAVSSSLLNAQIRNQLGVSHSKAAVAFPIPGRRRSVFTASGDPLGRAVVDGVLAAAPQDVDEVVVAGGADGGVDAWVGRVPLAQLSTAQVGGIDPASGLRRITGSVEGAIEVLECPDTAWPTAVGGARRAIASELTGLAQQILRIAVDHVTTRHQFGRPLGGFQAVRHRLAEAHVELAAAEAVLALAWEPDAVLESAGDVLDAQILGAAAKASAGRAYETASRHALQVCGAMGVTWEFPLHRLVRRGAVLNGLLGDASDLTAWLGTRILRREPMPLFDPLVPATAAL